VGKGELADALVIKHRPPTATSEFAPIAPQLSKPSASTILAPNPSTSARNRTTLKTLFSINRQNGEFELLRATEELEEVWCAGPHDSCILPRNLPLATICAFHPQLYCLNGLIWLTPHQVLAVDLLNPTPAAYALMSDSVFTTLD
jgi:hypothetical protein